MMAIEMAYLLMLKDMPLVSSPRNRAVTENLLLDLVYT